ncbi:hypothetical protein RJ641_028436 [Dillenia turbinata]|uniref:Uncharacterized protein n=1 Tax=Dillenia turbinata TaxID=194707 RepID=A0AAN8VZ88_9MAGN
MWNNDQVYVGLSSSGGNSTQTSFVYSWSFKLWIVPTWMHSEPLDPNGFSEKTDSPLVIGHKRSACVLRVLAALVFGTGCGALGALIVLILWTMLGNRRPVVPEDIAVHPVKFDYENIKSDVVKPINDGKKFVAWLSFEDQSSNQSSEKGLTARSGKLEGSEADVVQGFIVKNHTLISILNKLMNREGCIIRLNNSVRHLRRREN